MMKRLTVVFLVIILLISMVAPITQAEPPKEISKDQPWGGEDTGKTMAIPWEVSLATALVQFSLVI